MNVNSMLLTLTFDRQRAFVLVVVVEVRNKFLCC
jgi:hypothetical protein